MNELGTMLCDWRDILRIIRIGMLGIIIIGGAGGVVWGQQGEKVAVHAAWDKVTMT